MYRLIDTHAHLDEMEDLDRVLAEAREGGLVVQGYYISVTPAVEYHEEHRRAVKEIPLERMLLETDCPVIYQRGSENEFTSSPADVMRSLRGAAALKNVSEEKIAEVTTQNALRLFGIA